MNKLRVEHSKSKYAYNVLATRLGDKYKRCSCEYVVTGNKKIDDFNRNEAKVDAVLMSKAREMYALLIGGAKSGIIDKSELMELMSDIDELLNK